MCRGLVRPILMSWYRGGRLGNYGDPAAARSVFVYAGSREPKRHHQARPGFKRRSPAQPNRRRLAVVNARCV
jgi:hypothetical protein